jgi:hypothetical protein
VLTIQGQGFAGARGLVNLLESLGLEYESHGCAHHRMIVDDQR